ncbi:MAG TPA: tRNA (adenosine(37)-N6)-threonylcarbamoyltransferase complex ATPase subunit type 1 TsaE [Acidobacteriaceae bacterium]|nr:tRNA (adenosine(37)-N6)-threonylcarbamoyltransferase complex ATPase subunit type 1 TsaE [Acidobacteriaceae bacterium]
MAAGTGAVIEFTTSSADETIALGVELAQLLTPPKLILLRGDLGAGKTTLVKGIAAALGAAEPDAVTSPTFTLVHEYAGPVRVLHLDVYRLETERQLSTLGIEEMLEGENLVLIEWGEKFASLIERSDGALDIESIGEDTRRIRLSLK